MKFWTGFVIPGDEIHEGVFPLKGAGFTLVPCNEPRSPNRVYNGMEISIHAKSWSSAQRALDLVSGALELLQGSFPLPVNKFIAYNEDQPEWLPEGARNPQHSNVFSTIGMIDACALSAKASRNNRIKYGVFEYVFGLHLFTVHHRDLNPYSGENYPISSFPEDHILLGHAIISAYTCIEHLGLEVRATAEKPSMKDRKWNPEILDGLYRRLKEGGVDIDEPLLWLNRSTLRKTERDKPLTEHSRPSWSSGKNRDINVRIEDAINYASWLRSKVAAHGVNKYSAHISPYDVVNVQSLARRLLLESTGFWVKLM